MKEHTEKITVRLQYDPNKKDTIEVEIRQNATVADLKKAFENKLKSEKGEHVISQNPIGLLKLGKQKLNDEKKTLEELGINSDSVIENENRVRIKGISGGTTIDIICDENTTVRNFLKQLRNKNRWLGYIKLSFGRKVLPRSTLDQKLLGCKIGIDSISIKYGDSLLLCTTVNKPENDGEVFDLNNLDDTGSELNNSKESKDSNLVNKESKTLEIDNNVSSSERWNNHPRISSGSKKESKDSNYPLLRIIVGIADLLLLVAAVATFLLYFLTTLSLSIAIPIVLTALFVVLAVVFFGWKTILPKIWPKDCLKKINSGANLDKKNEYEIGEEKDNQKKNPEEEENENEYGL